MYVFLSGGPKKLGLSYLLLLLLMIIFESKLGGQVDLLVYLFPPIVTKCPYVILLVLLLVFILAHCAKRPHLLLINVELACNRAIELSYWNSALLLVRRELRLKI